MDFENRIGYTFKNKGLLKRALTHPSVTCSAKDFERFEFLGDRVLGLVITKWIFETFPNDTEGDLAKRLASLICRQMCETIGHKIQLKVRAKLKDPRTSVLADAVEALIGAIFLDSGLESCSAFIKKFWDIKHYSLPPKDSKSSLQEWVQSLGKSAPVYRIFEQSGPDHFPHFCVEVIVEGYPTIKGEGMTKKLAEHHAAQNMLSVIESCRL